MEEKKVKADVAQKVSYEQLEKENGSLRNMNNQLMAALQRANMDGLFKRLDYCFRVLELKNGLLSTAFVEKCAKEVEEIMTPPEEESEPESKE